MFDLTQTLWVQESVAAVHTGVFAQTSRWQTAFGNFCRRRRGHVFFDVSCLCRGQTVGGAGGGDIVQILMNVMVVLDAVRRRRRNFVAALIQNCLMTLDLIKIKAFNSCKIFWHYDDYFLVLVRLWSHTASILCLNLKPACWTSGEMKRKTFFKFFFEEEELKECWKIVYIVLWNCYIGEELYLCLCNNNVIPTTVPLFPACLVHLCCSKPLPGSVCLLSTVNFWEGQSCWTSRQILGVSLCNKVRH